MASGPSAPNPGAVSFDVSHGAGRCRALVSRWRPCRGFGQGPGRADQPGKIAGRDASEPSAGSRSGPFVMPRCREASRLSAKPSGGMRLRPSNRPPSTGQRHHQAHHHAGPCIGGMDRLGLAGLRAGRDCRPRIGWERR